MPRNSEVRMGVNRRRFLQTSALSVPLLGLGEACVSARTQHPTSVSTGADVLAAGGWRQLIGHRVGVLTNPTGVLSTRTDSIPHVVDDMHAGGQVNVVAVFGP